MSDHYKCLYDLSSALHRQNLDMHRTLQTIISHTGKALQVETGCLITFADGRIDHVYVVGADSESNDGMGQDTWEALLQRGLVGYVYHSDRIMVVRDISNDPRWMQLPDSEFLPASGSAVGIPLSKGSYVYGVMLFIYPELDYFDSDKLRLLEDIAELASGAMTNAYDMHAVRNSDVNYQAVFDGAVVPVILTDIAGFVQDANRKACDFLGYSRHALLNVPLQDLNIQATYDIRDMENGEERNFRSVIYDMDGREIPTLIRTRRLSLDGRVLVEWVLQDMSAQMELEQLRRDMTAMVYHDLRGPLTAILGSIYKLAEVLKNHEHPAVLRLLQIGLQSTRQLQRMVDSLLDIQRMEEGKTILNQQPTEMRVLVTDAVQLVQHHATEARQTLQMDVARTLPSISVDNDMLIRVMINLIENAIKYTPDGGTIRVSVQPYKHSTVLVKISDSGPGIPESMRKRIFDKFSRVKYQDAPKGVGLGLAFCRLAVEAHGGRIWVESEEGNGSDFCFTLPVKIEQDVDNTPDQVAALA